VLTRRASMLALVLSAILFTACRAEPRVMQVEITVDGMTCDSCVQAITYELGRVEGVRSVEVDLVGGKALVTFTEGQIDPAAIEQAIEKIGYEATPGEAEVVVPGD
jgi:copper ion binding protein